MKPRREGGMTRSNGRILRPREMVRLTERSWMGRLPYWTRQSGISSQADGVVKVRRLRGQLVGYVPMPRYPPGLYLQGRTNGGNEGTILFGKIVLYRERNRH